MPTLSHAHPIILALVMMLLHSSGVSLFDASNISSRVIG